MRYINLRVNGLRRLQKFFAAVYSEPSYYIRSVL